MDFRAGAVAVAVAVGGEFVAFVGAAAGEGELGHVGLLVPFFRRGRGFGAEVGESGWWYEKLR
jgi:hypothetical protein